MKRLRLRTSDLEWREIEDEVIAVDVQTSTYLSANSSGMVLWRALARGTTRKALVDRLVEIYGIDGERAGADVDRFLDDLRSRDLLAD
jgi:Coenzyme PQQ synthesis protein D (PqqD)